MLDISEQQLSQHNYNLTKGVGTSGIRWRHKDFHLKLATYLSTGDVAGLQNALFCGSCRVSRLCSRIYGSYRLFRCSWVVWLRLWLVFGHMSPADMMWKYVCMDNLWPRHFGVKTFRQQRNNVDVSWQFSRIIKVSWSHKCLGSKLSSNLYKISHKVSEK